MKHNIKELLPVYLFQDFPIVEAVVYVLILQREGSKVPFYVGQATNLHNRLRDYMSPQIAVTTDFKVGEAIKYFQEQGFGIEVAVKRGLTDTKQRRTEESRTIGILKNHSYKLLNDLGGFNYKTVNKEDERNRVKIYCDNYILNK